MIFAKIKRKTISVFVKFNYYSNFLFFIKFSRKALALIKLSKTKNLEDVLLAYIFSFESNLKIIEAGAGDGIDDSPSYLLEKLFYADTLLVEPIKSSFKECCKNRSGTVVNFALLGADDETPLKLFQEMTVRSLSRVKNSSIDGLEKRRVVRKEYYVNGIDFNSLCFQKFPDGKIDLLILDTEGTELEILRAINFKKIKIDVILVEHNYRPERIDIQRFLTSQRPGYFRIAKSISLNNDFYVRLDSSLQTIIKRGPVDI